MYFIEKSIYNKIDSFLKQKLNLLNQNGNYYNISYNNNNSELNYFSEIEIEFWKNDSIIDVYSILIFINNNVQGTEDEIIDYSVKDLKEIIQQNYS